MSSKDKDTFYTRLANLQKSFSKAESQLGDNELFRRDHISNVDIALLPIIAIESVIKDRSGFDMLAGFPKVQMANGNY